jgi:hypothetical protein
MRFILRCAVPMPPPKRGRHCPPGEIVLDLSERESRREDFKMTDQPGQVPNPVNFLARATAFVASLSLRQKLIGAGAIVVVVLVLMWSNGGGRDITINGYRLNEQELAYLDAVAGGQVPDGSYWLDPQSMAWGVVGNPQPMGIVGGGGQPSQGQAPHWADVGQNYRGPFGDYMSDGKCSAVNGIMVGDC